MFIIALAKMAGIILTVGGSSIALIMADDWLRPTKKDD